MSSHKKNNNQAQAHPAQEDTRHKQQEEVKDRSKSKDKKARRVNYVVKDLPIY